MLSPKLFMGANATLSVTEEFIQKVVHRLIPVSAIGVERKVSTPYGLEQLNGASPVLDVFLPGVAALRPLAEVSQGASIVRLAEYAPESLDVLDMHLSDPDNGSELYAKAKSSVYNLKARNPAKSDTVLLGKQRFTIDSYRPWLSEWLIRALAQRHDVRLTESGITHGPDLEARLAYEGGTDFTSKQYETMAVALSEIVEASGIKVKVKGRETGEEKDGIPSMATFKAYLEGEVKLPRMDWWELLRAFGTISQEAMGAYDSKSALPFLNRQGFYWAVRMFDTLRSFMRKRQFYASIKSAAEKERNGSWDYIPASKILAEISAGQVAPIDGVYDGVRVVANELIWNEKDLRQARAKDDRSGIYIHGTFPTVPQIAIKMPKELWVDFFSLYNLFNAMVVSYIGKTNQKLFGNSLNESISPAPTVLSLKFIPKFRALVMPFLEFDPLDDSANPKREVPEVLEDQVAQITAEIKKGSFDEVIGLPNGTTLRLIDVMKRISERVPAEISAYLFMSKQVQVVEAYLNMTPIERRHLRDYRIRAEVMNSLGLPESTDHRTGKKVLDKLKEGRTKVMKLYQRKYGGMLNGFVGLVTPVSQAGLSLVNLTRNGNGNTHHDPIDRFYPTTDYYTKRLLPTYGLDTLAKFAHLALTDQIISPSPEIRQAMTTAPRPFLQLNGTNGAGVTARPLPFYPVNRQNGHKSI